MVSECHGDGTAPRMMDEGDGRGAQVTGDHSDRALRPICDEESRFKVTHMLWKAWKAREKTNLEFI